MAKKKKINNKKDNLNYEFDPVKREVGGQEAEKVVWSTKALQAAVDALNQGLPLKVNPFIGKDTQLLKPELLYKRTEEEIKDYIKCMEDPVYFASKCFIMTPEGLQQCKLRDYQEDYLRLLKDNRFTIWLAARQVGKCLTFINKINIKLLNSVNNDNLKEKLKFYYIKDKDIYELPLFELVNLYIKQSWKWKAKYLLYKMIFKLTNEKDS